MTISIPSHDLLALALTVFVAAFAWCCGCGVYGLLTGGLAALRSRRGP
jgi:hypothetical protein